MQKNLTVSIFGRDYSIATDEHDYDIQHAALVVDTLMKQHAEKAPRASEARLAVIVALELASQVSKKDENIQFWEARVEELSKVIDSCS